MYFKGFCCKVGGSRPIKRAVPAGEKRKIILFVFIFKMREITVWLCTGGNELGERGNC